MKKIIGSALIVIKSKNEVESLNKILNENSEMILGRQGLSLKERNINIISLILEGSNEEIQNLNDKINKLNGLELETIFMKNIQ